MQQFPPTATISETMVPSSRSKKSKMMEVSPMTLLDAPPLLSFVAQVTEPRSFRSQTQMRPNTKSKQKSKQKDLQKLQSSNNSNWMIHGNKQNILKVDHVTVNHQNVFIEPSTLHSKSFMSGLALGTQRLQSTQGHGTSKEHVSHISSKDNLASPLPADLETLNADVRRQLSNLSDSKTSAFFRKDGADLKVWQSQQQTSALTVEEYKHVSEAAHFRKQRYSSAENPTQLQQQANLAMVLKQNKKPIFVQESTIKDEIKANLSAVLFEDYQGFMQSQRKKNQNDEQEQTDQEDYSFGGSQKNHLNTVSSCEKNTTEAHTSTRDQNAKNPKSSVQKMEENLKKNFHQMRKFVQSADRISNMGVTGTSVKTNQGRAGALENRVSRQLPNQIQSHFSQIRMNQMEVNSLESINRRVNQKIILLAKNDVYKQTPHAPLWSVPTSKKVRRSQPSQSSGGRYSETNGSTRDINATELGKSQANFYKTTRSIEVGEWDFTNKSSLAIDHRNTINLQKAIDKYYDGDLSLDEQHNGDIHFLQMAQNNQKKLDSQNQKVELISKISTTKGTHHGQQLSAQIHHIGEKIEFKRDSSQTIPIQTQSEYMGRDLSENSNKGKLHGSKFRQSQMMGFRKLSSGPPSKTNSLQDSTAYLKEQNSSDRQNKNKIGPDCLVSGFSFQGTYKIDGLETQSNFKKRSPHKIYFGALPDQSSYGEGLDSNQQQQSIITQHDPNMLETQNNSIVMSRRLPSDPTNAVSPNIDRADYTQEPVLAREGTLYLPIEAFQVANINQDLTQVIPIRQNMTRHSDQLSAQFSRRETQLSPKFKDAIIGPSLGGLENTFGVSGDQIKNNQIKKLEEAKYGKKNLQKQKLLRNQPTASFKVSLLKDYQNMLQNNNPAQLYQSSLEQVTLSRGEDLDQSLGTQNVQSNRETSKQQTNFENLAQFSESQLQSKFIPSGSALIETTQTRIQHQKTFAYANPNKDEISFALQAESQSLKKRKPETDQTNNHYYQLGNERALLSFDSKLGSDEFFRRNTVMANELKNASTPIVVGRLSADSSSVSIRPQSVILSRLSYSKKKILSNQDGTDPTPDKDVEIQSVNQDFDSQDQDVMSPKMNQKNFLATAIYQNLAAMPTQTDFVIDQRSRSISEVKNENKVEKIVQSKSPTKVSPLPKQILNFKPSTQENSNEAASLRSKDNSSPLKKPPMGVAFAERRSTDPGDSLPKFSMSGQMRMPQILMPNPINKFMDKRGFPVSSGNSPSTRPIQTMPQQRNSIKSIKLSQFSGSKLLQGLESDKAGVITKAQKDSSHRTTLQVGEKSSTLEFQITEDQKEINSLERKNESSEEDLQAALIPGQMIPAFKVQGSHPFETINSVKPGQESRDFIQNQIGVAVPKKDRQTLQYRSSDYKFEDPCERFETEPKNSQFVVDDSPDKKREFKLLGSDLNEDVYVEDDIAEDHADFTSGKSPIRVQTTKINKSSQQLESTIDKLSAEMTEKSTINMSAAAYIQQGNMRPSRTAGTLRRETLQTSQVVMIPIDLALGSYKLEESRQIQVLNDTKNMSQRTLAIAKGVFSPYQNYLHSANLEERNIQSQGFQMGEIQNDMQTQTTIHPYSSEVQDHPSDHRPRTSMQQINSVCREIKKNQQVRKQAVLLQRNICMNVRKSKLMLQGQIDKSKRLAQANRQPTRASKSQNMARPNRIAPMHDRHENSTSDSQMRMVYSQEKSQREPVHQSQVNQGNQTTSRIQSIQEAFMRKFGTKIQFRQTNMENSMSTLQKRTASQGGIQLNYRSRGRQHNRSSTLHLHGSSPNEHNRASTLQLKTGSNQHTEESPNMSAKHIPSKNHDVLIKENSKASPRLSLSKKSGSGGAVIKEMQSMLQNLENTSEHGSRQELLLQESSHNFNSRQQALPKHMETDEGLSTKHMMLKAALAGQPAAGVGREIVKKRDKLKLIYKTGRRKISTQAGWVVKQPERAKTSLDSRQDVQNASSFSIQGNKVDLHNSSNFHISMHR